MFSVEIMFPKVNFKSNENLSLNILMFNLSIQLAQVLDENTIFKVSLRSTSYILFC